MAQSREEKLAVRCARERRPDFREKRRAYMLVKQREYLAKNPAAAERNRQRALQRAAELRAFQWLHRLFADTLSMDPES